MSDGGSGLAERAVELRTWIATGQARCMRTAAGLSQAQVAHDCEVSASAVHRWETGNRSPRGRNVAAYHRFLTRLVEQANEGEQEDVDPDL